MCNKNIGDSALLYQQKTLRNILFVKIFLKSFSNFFSTFFWVEHTLSKSFYCLNCLAILTREYIFRQSCTFTLWRSLNQIYQVLNTNTLIHLYPPSQGSRSGEIQWWSWRNWWVHLCCQTCHCCPALLLPRWADEDALCSFLMTKGTAEVWAHNQTQAIIDSMSSIPTFEAFIKQVENAFGDPDCSRTARTKLHDLKMSLSIVIGGDICSFVWVIKKEFIFFTDALQYGLYARVWALI